MSARLFAWMVALSACAPSADDPLSRLDVAGPETGEYRVRFLNPPWELVSVEGTTTFVRIQSNAMMRGLEGGLGKYELTATLEPGTPDARIAAEAASAPSRGETVIAGPRSVENDDGVLGQELIAYETEPFERYYRYVYFPLAGQVVRLAFEATPSLDNRETDAMIGHVGIGPEP